MHYKYFLLLCFLPGFLLAQELYFPPTFGEWETLAPEELNWCETELNDLHAFLEERDSKAFLILKDGRLVVEWYYDTFTRDSIWYWASAGKSLMATLTGIAQEEGLISIDDPTRDYLGAGWTSLTPEQEAEITIRHQLSMTSGLNDIGVNVDCTAPECLSYLAEPGTRWAYHNAPYTLLGAVIEAASGSTINQFFASRIGTTIGAFGAYVNLDDNRVFFSRARDMARFGLLIQADGQWNGTTVLGDQEYLNAMRTPSQDINPAYGYLWWLNGQERFLQPRLQFYFDGSIIPTAPADMYAALGKNDQKLYIVPSEGLVVVRLGNDAGEGLLALSDFDSLLWEKISGLACATATDDNLNSLSPIEVMPNPASDLINLNTAMPLLKLRLRNMNGQAWELPAEHTIDVSTFSAGLYILEAQFENGGRLTKKIIIE